MSKWLVPWIATLITYAFIDMGGPVGESLSSMMFGLLTLWIWIAGAIYSVVEYRQSQPPDWMIWLVDKPSENKSLQRPRLLKCISAVVAIGGTIAYIIAGILSDEYSLFFGAIGLMMTWCIGVFLIERYFRCNFTPVLNDSNTTSGLIDE